MQTTAASSPPEPDLPHECGGILSLMQKQAWCYTWKKSIYHLLLIVFLFDTCIFLSETLHPAGGIEDFLFTRHEGMTVGTNFYLDVFFGGLGVNHISTDTRNRCIGIFRVNIFFHVLLNLLTTLYIGPVKPSKNETSYYIDLEYNFKIFSLAGKIIDSLNQETPC